MDYGLASRYIHMGIHRPFEPDQRSAHEGTLEYVSRDGHLGCVSRRGDMECLLYVAIEWMGGHLPWDTDDENELWEVPQEDRETEAIPSQESVEEITPEESGKDEDSNVEKMEQKRNEETEEKDEQVEESVGLLQNERKPCKI